MAAVRRSFSLLAVRLALSIALGLPVVAAATAAASRVPTAVPRQPAAADPDDTFPAFVSRDDARADLDVLEQRLEDQAAYAFLRGDGWRDRLERLRDALPDPVPVGQFADQLGRFLATLGDAHAGAASPHQRRPTSYPPFVLGEAEGGVVAMHPDRLAFLDPERPFLTAIDGQPLQTWLDAAAEDIPVGSPQGMRARAIIALFRLERLRERLDVAADPTVLLTLASQPDGADAVLRSFDLIDAPAGVGTMITGESAMLEDDIGYLRLRSMRPESLARLQADLVRVQGAAGLIIDVRGNFGGTRDALRVVADFLSAPEDAPWVGNVAKPIRSERLRRDRVDAQYLARADDLSWTAAERAAIAAAAASFEAEWEPVGDFDAWHHLVLGRTSSPESPSYRGPVVILCDAHAFGATDVFLGALRGRPGVTLMGTASAGGDGLVASFFLPRSRVRVACSSTASFRPDGRLYDGRGVPVDITVTPRATDLLLTGGDRVLETAIDQLLDERIRPRGDG